VVWIYNLLNFLNIPIRTATLFCDNQATLYSAANPVCYERTKHIEVDYNLVRERLVSADISTCYTPTTEQVVDIFTKALGQRQF